MNEIKGKTSIYLGKDPSCGTHQLDWVAEAAKARMSALQLAEQELDDSTDDLKVAFSQLSVQIRRVILDIYQNRL